MVALRRRAWERIAAGLDRADIDRAALGAVTTRHGLSAAKELAPSLLAGQVRGRIVLDLAA